MNNITQAAASPLKELELILDSTGVGVWVWNIKSGETTFNRRWADILGYELNELSPVSIETWLTLAHPEDLEESNRRLQEHWAGETTLYECESRMRHKNGDWVWVYDSGRVVEWAEDGSPVRMVGTHYDITEQKRMQFELLAANDELERLAATDPLTGAANRRAFDQRLSQLTALKRREGLDFALVLLDIDDFKLHNDIHGHAYGDSVLKLVADTAARFLKRETDVLARLGGDEFALLLPGTPLDDARALAQAIVVALNDAASTLLVNPKAPRLPLRVSFGVAASHNDSEEAYRTADRHLYQAKRLTKAQAVIN